MHKTFIIAEVGQAHDGSLGILHSYIDAFADTGIDAIKFQTHIADAESSLHEPFRVNFTYEDKTRFDYWKRMEFSKEQWHEIKIHCEEKNIEFLSSPFSIAAVELLENIGIRRYKIGSGEVTNFLMLEKIAQTGKPVILSSGMSTYAELDKTVNFLDKFDIDVSILQCTTAYPTPYNNLGLNIITELRNRYPNKKIGLSEHTGEIFAALAAVSLGAEIIEFHIVYDKKMFGPDSICSLTREQTSLLVKGIRSIEESLNNPIDKNNNSSYKELKNIFEKSLALNCNINKGTVLEFDFLESKKPANMGIPSSEYKKIIGKKVNKNIKKWSFLKYDDLEE